MPPPMELDDREYKMVDKMRELRAYTRQSPCYIEKDKRTTYIERYQDRYNPSAPKIPLYRYIEPYIDLLPEELVTGKAKRLWRASKRSVDTSHPDATELFGEPDEEEGEEESQKDEEEDAIDLDEEPDAEDEGDYAYQDFSDDDEAMDADEPDGTRKTKNGEYWHPFHMFPCTKKQELALL